MRPTWANEQGVQNTVTKASSQSEPGIFLDLRNEERRKLIRHNRNIFDE